MNLKDINNNPIANSWKKRYNTQTKEVRKKLDELKKMNFKDYQLKVIKKTRKDPITGDIFLLSPREKTYFFGKVIKSDIVHITKDTFIHRKNLVFIFNCKTDELNTDKFISNYDNLLIPPVIVDKSYWTKGFFYTIGKEDISKEEKELNYGFYKIGNGKYYKENGIELSRPPRILGTYGIASISGVASMIEKELIINPSLLK